MGTFKRHGLNAMANFNTHLIVASTASGLAATTMLGAGIAKPEEVLLYFAAGAVGGLLPDLDSDNSVLLKVMFSVLGVLFSFLAMFTQAKYFSVAELVIIWLLCFLSMNYGLFLAFKKFTVHRGIFHSLPAGVFYGLLATFLSHAYLKFGEVVSWATGFFIFLGYLSHLLLDEIFSVDLSNKKIKKSWGTALKLFERKNIAGTIVMYLAVLLLFFISPSPQKFLAALFKSNASGNLQRNLFPQGQWFEARPGPE